MILSVVGPTHPFRGGISHHTSLLVRSLRARHSVQFFSFSRQYPRWLYPGNGDRDPSSTIVTYEVPNQIFDALKLWKWRKAALQVAELKPQLAILPWSTVYWSPFYWVFLWTLKRVHGPKTVFICHNVIEHEASRPKTFISRRVLTQADFFIVHSQWDKSNLLHWMSNTGPDRIWVCPHPVYTHLIQPTLSKEEARALIGVHAERVLLFFGFVREYKGLRYLIESLPLINARLPVHLVIAGEVWGDSKPYIDLIHRLNLSSAVTFIQKYIPNEEVAHYFGAADLVVAPYTSATQSGIVQLAYGFAKPILVGRVGGLPEAVEEGKTGYLVPPRDPQAIARAVADFYTNQREPLMVEAVQERQAVNSWERLCRTIEEISGSANGQTA
jgi:glycosyltransferase involved in cell wall biosynthesis